MAACNILVRDLSGSRQPTSSVVKFPRNFIQFSDSDTDLVEE